MFLDLVKTYLIFRVINAAHCIHQWAGYDIQSGFYLHPETAFLTTLTLTSCECRQICESKYCCFAYSTRPMREKWMCQLHEASFGEFTTSLKPTLIGEIGSRIVPDWKRGDDGLYYKFLSKPVGSWEAAKAACLALDIQARLPLVKTIATLNILTEYAATTPNFVAIDINKKTAADIILGDGTLLKDTPLWKSNPDKVVTNGGPTADIYIVTRGQIHDELRNQAMYVACQANFLGITY